MKPNQDAYGNEVYDYSLGKPTLEIVEREDGLISASGGGQPPILRRLKTGPPHKRKPCSMWFRGGRWTSAVEPGRVALYLQEQGLEVVGIDNSPLAVKVCQKRGVKDARLLSITQVSAKMGVFDNILMLGNNFGLFTNFERAQRLLKLFLPASPLRERRMIVESTDPYATEDVVHLAYQAANRKRGRMSGQIRIRIRYRTFKGMWFDYLLVSKDEMKEILAGTGWRVKTFLDYDIHYISILEKE